MRTPLTSILGYSKLLIDRPDVPAERRARWGRFILEKSRLLNRLVNDVLDLSRLNMGRFELQFKAVRLDALIRRVADEFSLATDRHQIVVEVAGSPASIQADEDRLEQVLANLLSKAIKYSPAGGLVQIRLKEVGNCPQLRVSDHGVGIAPEHFDRILEPFYRVDNSTARSIYGSGLGLAVSRGIVEAHGGTLTVESTLGEGSSFFITIPRQTGGEGELRLLIDSRLE
ncbi:MAG: cell wall metabolism sensor histidine kinase WalK [Ardenticatenaceae bacterium]|nr:cell wall metabolism sensor histidine kinase WalK [Ardenticatenaceae bacterium]